MRNTYIVFFVLALMAVGLVPAASADGFGDVYGMTIFGRSVGEYVGARYGGQIGGAAGAAGAYALVKDESTITRLAAGMAGGAIGKYVGRSIGGAIGKRVTGGLLKEGERADSGVSFSITCHRAPMATVGWKF